MSYKLVYDDTFIKKTAKIIKKNPSMKDRINKTLHLLEDNPYHPSLRLHKLRGKLKEYYSVSISMSYRIVIDLIITDKEIILLDIGSHDEVY
ncbi:type II toxin-antitoxin system RelE/ParE family toxin [Nitratiruptor tergarcus]|uniref:Addiction module toxin, RelE/StbE family n=1 Tax=Nitratiruptor tergarcus DSM 16512 TaxID=1069081 RepID=A0A1W1WV36_9BACT|nr:type II toxin-antitoxin system mRNA interferase toxin, RelE/StbE family [Nitratiruptor tergarcus]SMC10052.1 addiction module toxin, RelE/StbE family [Nitratiruptor tergarcus DSM 16512]